MGAECREARKHAIRANCSKRKKNAASVPTLAQEGNYMWETTDYCEIHESYWNDDFPCECHLLRAADRETDYQIELWKERMR